MSEQTPEDSGSIAPVPATTNEMMGAPVPQEEEAIQFPIYPLTRGVKLPEEGIYYVIGSNGLFIHKPNRMGRSLVRVDGVSHLEPVHSFIMPKLPKLPARIVVQALTFFRQVYHAYRSESGLVLFYNDATHDFLLWCPNQEVSYGSCRYDRNDSGQNEANLVGYNIVGSIHSHADFGAFHSGTDIGDEIDFDGLHITIGNVDKEAFTMCASVAVGKQREPVEPEYCANGIVRQPPSDNLWLSLDRTYYKLVPATEQEQAVVAEDAENIRKFWLPKVSRIQYSYPSWGGMGFVSGYGGKKKSDVAGPDEYDELTGRWGNQDF